MKKRMFFSIQFISFVVFFTACATQTSREKIAATRESAHHKPAADSMDGFWLDYRSPPDREAQHWEFYYKTCTFMGHKPWPDRSEYECLGPH